MRNLQVIAKEVRKDWSSPYVGATPWLMYMSNILSYSLNTEYMGVSGKEAVTEFLANADSWETETAEKIKAELKKMLG